MSGDCADHYDESQEPESDLDPRIQIELEALNNATDDINKLEMELDESNTTFRMLMNESTRRLKILNRKLGSCIERARPYYEALEVAKQAQQECQKAAVKFQRANEIHQAAKETVALAEARFLSKQHEWKFDSAWQEMLNNAIQKVTDAENQKSESGREHQKKATLFHAAETKVQLLEARLKRNIIKSRPYFEEKALCEGQLNTQKARVLQLREAVKRAKGEYAASLRRLEDISEEIHMRRRRESTCGSPTGPREPGVGAELSNLPQPEVAKPPDPSESYHLNSTSYPHPEDTQSLDIEFDLDKCDIRSLGSSSVTNSSRMSYDSGDESSSSGMNQEDLEKLRMRVRELATTPVDGWESELDATVNKLDNMLHQQEVEAELKKQSESLRQQSPKHQPKAKESPSECQQPIGVQQQQTSPTERGNVHPIELVGKMGAEESQVEPKSPTEYLKSASREPQLGKTGSMHQQSGLAEQTKSSPIENQKLDIGTSEELRQMPSEHQQRNVERSESVKHQILSPLQLEELSSSAETRKHTSPSKLETWDDPLKRERTSLSELKQGTDGSWKARSFDKQEARESFGQTKSPTSSLYHGATTNPFSTSFADSATGGSCSASGRTSLSSTTGSSVTPSAKSSSPSDFPCSEPKSSSPTPVSPSRSSHSSSAMSSSPTKHNGILLSPARYPSSLQSLKPHNGKDSNPVSTEPESTSSTREASNRKEAGANPSLTNRLFQLPVNGFSSMYVSSNMNAGDSRSGDVKSFSSTNPSGTNFSSTNPCVSVGASKVSCGVKSSSGTKVSHVADVKSVPSGTSSKLHNTIDHPLRSPVESPAHKISSK